MKNTIYLLEEANTSYVAAYDTREKATLAGLAKYADWLKNFSREDTNYFDSEQIADDLETLILQGYIEDYVYIVEAPYYGE